MSIQVGTGGVFQIWRRFRLGQKVMFALCAACVPLIGLGIQVANVAESLMRSQLQDNLALAASLEAGRLDQSLAFVDSTTAALTRDPELQEAARNSAQFVADTQTANQLQSFVDVSGGRLESSGLVALRIIEPQTDARSTGSQVGWGSISREALSQAELYNPDASQLVESYVVDGEPRIVTIRQVGQGVPLKLVAEWSVPQILSQASLTDDLGFEVDSLLLQQQSDGQFVVLVGSANYGIGITRSLDVSPPVVGEPSVADVVDDNGKDVVQAAAKTEAAPAWTWLVEAPQQDVYGPLRIVELSIVAVFLSAGFVILAVVAAAFRGFARRLERMTLLAEAVAAGDLTVRTGDPRMDELGRLSMAFDDMAQALSEDIARRERMEAQLAYQATHDSLTGLPNRQQLVDELDVLLNDSADVVSALFIDLDGFKEVNDRLGHAAGDELLTRVGDRLRDVLRPSDFVARLGGDEFVVVLKGFNMLDAERTASRVVAALELPFIVMDEEVGISASIGVSSTDSERSAERLLKEADIAMYQAKALGKGRAIRVTEETLSDVDERLSLSAALRSAVANDDLQLMFWPTCDLRSGTLTGMEATVRWVDDERGVVTPAEFLALAKRSGLATQIDEWVIRASVATFASWKAENLPVSDLQLAINLTPESFASQKTRHLFVGELTNHGLDASNFRIEIPEETLRADGAQVRDAFKQFRSLGVAVTIDQFGSDYSSLDRLPRYAIDSVKIDLALTLTLTNRVSSRALITSLITLAQTSGMRVAAAGIDDDALRNELLSLGCTEGQGSWFSGVVDTRAFRELLCARDLLGFLTN